VQKTYRGRGLPAETAPNRTPHRQHSKNFIYCLRAVCGLYGAVFGLHGLYVQQHRAEKERQNARIFFDLLDEYGEVGGGQQALFWSLAL
jgi:hypothetical protein